MAKRVRDARDSVTQESPQKPRRVSYKIRITPAARRELKKLAKKLSKTQLKEVSRAIDRLGVDPRPNGVEKLADTDKIYRITCGSGKNHRIIYQVRDKQVIVIVVKVSDRKEAYQDIFKMIKARIQSLEISLR